jgi:protocatechuate 3,4-dioxygenase beta subunit
MKVAPREWGGTVLDADGRPVADATIVAGASGTSRPAHQVLKTDAEGRFTWPLPTATDMLFLVAYKDGLTAAAISAHPSGLVEPHAIRLRLAAPVPFSATLVDTDGRPVAGAKVRVEMMAHGSASKNGETTNVSVGYTRVSREVLSGTPAEDLFTTTTAADGSFTFRAIRPDTGLKLAVAAPDGREFRIKADPGIVGLVARTMQDQGFVTAPPGRATRLLAVPAARVGGRVVTKLPGVGVSGLRASYQDSHQPGVYQPRSNFGADARTDADGRFAFDGLNEGTVNVFVHGDGENKDWTYRAAKDVVLTPGATSEVTLELVRGVDVEGTVVTQSTGAPVEGAQLGVYGPHRPRTGAMTTGARTDARGRYHYRLPSGETYFYVMGPPGGYSKLAGEGSSRTVKIPDGASRYEVPPIELATAVTVSGRVVDAAGTPVAGARVVGVCQGSRCVPLEGMQAVTDSAGGFRLPAGWYNTVPVGQVAHLLIRLRDGDEHEAAALPTADGAVTVKLNAVVQRPKPDARPRGAAAVEGPREVAPGELAGVVVDRDGNPIEGVEADVNHWAPGQVTHTDRGGKFQFTGLSKDESRHPVRFRKEGYETQYHLDRKAGRPGWVVVLGNTTYFEGRVLAPDGSPVPDAVVRADSGPRRGIGFMMGECYTETTSRPDGRYRLHVEPGAYDVEVRVPGVGVARSKDVIDADQTVKRDIRLEPGVTFVILTIEHGTGRPVGGVRLEHWMKPGIEGTSGPDGRIVIRDVPPGTYSRFEVKADGYTRWWSDACLSEWKRSHRNSDWLDFEVKPGMSPVTVEMERGATVTGRVLDPDGKPVAGATVALPLTGTGFSVETDNDGRFSALLPASGDREYNLVTHDGKYNQWRSWANGVSPAFRTKPGEQVTGLDLRLTRPASVRGRVTDTEGRPVANRQVRASAADRMENGYYDPTTRTDADGTYELKFIRPGQQYVQIAPFWGDARQAPEGTSRTLTLSEGEVKDGVEFQVTGRNGVD